MQEVLSFNGRYSTNFQYPPILGDTLGPADLGPQASGLEAVKVRCRCERGVWICIRMRSGTAVEHVLDAAIESAPRHLIVGRYTDKDRIMHELRRTRERERCVWTVSASIQYPDNLRHQRWGVLHDRKWTTSILTTGDVSHIAALPVQSSGKRDTKGLLRYDLDILLQDGGKHDPHSIPMASAPQGRQEAGHNSPVGHTLETRVLPSVIGGSFVCGRDIDCE